LEIGRQFRWRVLRVHPSTLLAEVLLLTRNFISGSDA
jgi:hypothetical protein